MRRIGAPVLARYLSLALQLLVVSIIVRQLSDDEAGIYFVVSGTVLTGMFLAGVGLPDGVVRTLPSLRSSGENGHARWILRRAAILLAISLPPLAVVTFAVGFVTAGDFVTGLLAAAWWTAMGLIFSMAQFAVALDRSELGALLFYSSATLGQVAVSVPLVLLTPSPTLNGILLSLVAGTWSAAAVGLVVFIVRTRSEWRGVRVRPVDGLTFAASWRQGLSIAGGRVVQTCLIWTPVWVSFVVLAPSDAALVGVAARVLSAVAGAVAAVRFTVRPRISRDAAAGRWKAIEIEGGRIAVVATAFAIASLAAILLVGPPLFTLVFGNGYEYAAPITAALLIGTVGESLGGTVDEVLKMSGSAALVLSIQVMAVPVAVAIQVIAAAAGGPVLQSVGYSLAWTAMYGAFIIFAWRRLHILLLPRWRGRYEAE